MNETNIKNHQIKMANPRTRLCVTFEMDRHHEDEIYNNNDNDRRHSYTTTTLTTNRNDNDRLCLQDADVQGEFFFPEINILFAILNSFHKQFLPLTK